MLENLGNQFTAPCQRSINHCAAQLIPAQCTHFGLSSLVAQPVLLNQLFD